MTDKPRMKVLQTAHAVLEALSDSQHLSQAELAERLDIPRATVYRVIDALEAEGLVRSAGEGRQALGPRIFRLARAARDSFPVAASRPAMQWLGAETGQTVFLSIPRDAGMLCLDRLSGPEVEVMILAAGGVLPWNAGAASRAFLAEHPLREDILQRVEFESFTPGTIMTQEELRADAEEVAERGFSISDGDLTVGVAAIGRVVHDADGNPVGSLSLAGLRGRVLGSLDQMAEALVAAVDQAERDISFSLP